MAWVIWKEPRRLRRARGRFVAGKEPLSDADFLRKIGASGPEEEVCLAIRNALADVADVPPQMIISEDPLDSVALLSFDGADQIEWIMSLEKELGISIPNRDVREMRVEGRTVGEYVIALARKIEPLVAARQPQEDRKS